MVDATLFDKLETIARRFGASDKPFGGIQVKYCYKIEGEG
jgi:hypothetical protein